MNTHPHYSKLLKGALENEKGTESDINCSKILLRLINAAAINFVLCYLVVQVVPMRSLLGLVFRYPFTFDRALTPLN